MSTTIAADPLALMPRGDAAVAGAAPVAASGEGADFALALADVMGAESAPAAAEGAVSAAPAVVAEGAEGPLPLLEGLGKIVSLVTAPAEAVVAGGEGAVPSVEGAVDVAVPADAEPVAEVPVDAVETVAAPVDAPVENEVPPAAIFPRPDGDVAEAEGDSPAPEETGEEIPVAELAEAVTVAVAAVVAPIAAPQTPAKAEVPQGDAGAESVRMAGAAALMATPAKPREAKPAVTDAPKAEAAPEEAAGEEAEAPDFAREKGERPVARPVARPVHGPSEHAAQPQAERRAPEPVAARAEAVRAPDVPAPQASMPTTAPVPTNAPAAPVAMDRPGWEGVITERIAAELSADGQQIELELTPDNLGGLKIRLEVSDGQAQVRFVTETPEAARLIQQNEHRLSESLSRAGLSLGGHETGSRDAQQQQGDRSGRPAPRGAEIAFQRSGEPRAGMVPQRAQAGLVNLMA